jgi:hypothetical protein
MPSIQDVFGSRASIAGGGDPSITIYLKDLPSFDDENSANEAPRIISALVRRWYEYYNQASVIADQTNRVTVEKSYVALVERQINTAPVPTVMRDFGFTIDIYVADNGDQLPDPDVV